MLDKINSETHPDSSMNFSLKMLAYVWSNPAKTKERHHYAFNLLFCLVAAGYYYLIIKQFLNLEAGDIDMLSKSVASFTSYFQTFLTVFPMAIYRNNFKQLIASRRLFWKADKAREPELQVQLDRIFNTSYKFLCLSFFLAWVAGLLYVAKSIFNRELCVECYVPDFPYAFEILLAGQYLCMPVLCTSTFGMNSLYVSLCVDAMAQFKLLMHRLTSLDIQQRQDICKLRELIQYHNFLLKFVEEIQVIYSFPLLGQYLISMVATCMNLFTLTNNLASFSTRLLSAGYILAIDFFFSLYCFTATSLSTTMSEVPDSFYFSKWEEGAKEFRNCIPLCLMRAQKDFQVKAGGMMEINRGAVTVVFKTSYSFLLILRNMKE